ncbi:LysR family transcriptional regulator [Vibrio inusitatus]|nr:LysR family transcriptional regulator [Vibrio inusitatus]
MNKNVDIIALIAFKKTIEHRSLSSAAKEMKVSNSTITRKISELESYYGVSLITRTTRSLSATEEGEILYKYCKQTLDVLSNAEAEITNFQDEYQGEISIVTNIGLHGLVSHRLVSDYCQNHPNVKVNFTTYSGDMDLWRQNIDVWIKAGPVNDDKLITRSFEAHPIIVVATQKYLNTKSDIVNINSIGSDHTQVFLSLHHMGIESPISSVPYQLKTDQVIIAKNALLCDMGLCAIPKAAVMKELATGEVIDVFPHDFKKDTTITVAYKERKHRPARLESFLEVLFTHLSNVKTTNYVD